MSCSSDPVGRAEGPACDPGDVSEYDNELSQLVAQLNRAAPSQQKAATARGPQSTASLEGVLQTAAGRGASDVLLIAGAPPMFRINGNLAAGSGPALDGDDVEFGTERVSAMLEASRGRTAAEQAAALLSAVRRHRGLRQSQDDVTVMVIRAIGGQGSGVRDQGSGIRIRGQGSGVRSQELGVRTDDTGPSRR